MIAQPPPLAAAILRLGPLISGADMAEDGNAGQAAAASAQPNIGVVAQYVKDFSFENPGAPASLRPRNSQPSINISIGVQSSGLSASEYEVELKINVNATDGQQVLFVIELVYAGVFRVANFPQEQLGAAVLIECPRLLFPFARQIVADASRNGGFPPLLIDPVDFVQLYRQQLQNAAAAGAPPSAPN
jgi:preprotein translocase subunit SecB